VRQTANRDVILASSNAGLHLVPNAAEAALYFDENTRRLAQPGVAAYVRALGALAQRQDPAAVSYLRAAVDQNPGNVFADTNLVELYYRLRQFGEITKVYDKLGMRPFEGSAESLAQICLSLWTEGQQDRARDVLKYAQTSFPGNPLVDAVKKSVH